MEKIHVLVVDDNPVNLTMALAFLAAFTIEADTALSGAEALAMIEKMHSSSSAYDLVFMDHLMPEMDGIETTKHIRAWEEKSGNKEQDNGLENAEHSPQLLERPKSVPIIVLTANAASGMKEMFLEKGFNDFISKPLEKEELERVLKQWIPQDKIRLIQNAIQTDADIIDIKYDLLIKELSAIKGLDLKSGLSHTGNNYNAYFTALRQFTENCTAYAEDLNNTLQAENWEAYIINAHALKGILAAFGAGRLSLWASNLENAAKSVNYKQNRDETLPFCSALLDFRNKICKTSLLVCPSNTSADNNNKPDGAFMSDKKIILAVDDMTENLTIMRSILEKHYDARLAKSAKMALELLNNTHVDLILLDIEMPGMTGFQFLEQLNRKDSPNKDTPVIFVTSHADRDLINKAINAGAKDYIVKPVKAESLYKKINSVFDSSGSITNPLEENLNILINAAASGDSKRSEVLLKEILTITKPMGGDIHSSMTEIAKLILNFDYERGIRKIETLLHNVTLKKK